MSDIASLLRQVADGNRPAFSSLYTNVQPEMLRYATGMLAGDIDAAADAVDEAFLVVWKSAQNYSGEGNAKGWIRRIVRNKVIDWVRKQKEVKFGDADTEKAVTEGLPDTGDTPEMISMKTSRRAELSHAISQIKDEFREVLWLCYFEDKSLKDIAMALDIPQNTVKTRLFHARKALKSALPVHNAGEGLWP